VGFASKSSLADLSISFDPPADYGKIAEAAGAWSARVENANELESALKGAVKIVQGGQSAVLNVLIKQ
jgi:acetolactate synthase I/II/III large subunit